MQKTIEVIESNSKFSKLNIYFESAQANIRFSLINKKTKELFQYLNRDKEMLENRINFEVLNFKIIFSSEREDINGTVLSVVLSTIGENMLINILGKYNGCKTQKIIGVLRILYKENALEIPKSVQIEYEEKFIA